MPVRQPVLPLLATAYALGILLSSGAAAWALSLLIVLLVGCLALAVSKQVALMAQLLLLLACGAAGWLACTNAYVTNPGLTQGQVSLQARLLVDALPTIYGQQAQGQVLKCPTQPQLTGCSLVLYLPATLSAQQGAILQLSGKLQDLSPIRQPDYAAYLARKGLVGTLTVNQGQLIAPPGGFYKLMGGIRQRFQQQLARAVPEGDAVAVGTALILGSRTLISEGTKTAYRQLGITHLLAISGMHLVLILSFVTAVLGLGGLQRAKPWLLLTGLLLIFYGFLVGNAPAVVRAVLMSVIALTVGILQRPQKAIHLLWLCFLLQLVYDPMVLYDVGFQLSYSAVLGILLLQPLWHVLPRSGQPVLRSAVEIITTTLAAQLFTLPTLLVHFGQVPVYFLLANLLLIPLSSLATLAGFVLLLCCWSDWLSQPLAETFGMLVYFMNQLTVLLSSLPSATITGVKLSWQMGLLLFIMLAACACYLGNRLNHKQHPVDVLQMI